MATGKIPFTESCPKFSFTAMGFTVVQLPQCHFTAGVKGNCFLGFGLTISLVSFREAAESSTIGIF